MSESERLPSEMELGLLENERVVKRRVVDEHYKDIFFLFLFLIHILVVIFLAFSYGFEALRGGGPETVIVKSNGDQVHQHTHDYETLKIVGGITIILVFAGSVSACWIYFLSKYAASIISAVLMCVIMGTFLSGVGLIGLGYVPIGACLISTGVIIIMGSLFFRPRIDFAAANLKIACEAIITMPSTLMYALLILVAQIVFIIIWVIAASGYTTNNYSVSQSFNGILYNIDECTTYKYSTSFDAIGQTFTCTASSCQTCICGNTWVSNKACFTSRFYVPAFFGLLLSLFWTSAVCSNIVHCTTSASVATWWSTDISNTNEVGIVKESFQRACTSSLGSICFGSLLVAIVRVLRSCVMLIHKRMKSLSYYDTNSTSTKIQMYILAIFDYSLNCLDRIIVYFNRYAFCFVAIYGFDFLQASKHAMDLFVSKGWTALLNDDIIDLILNLGNILIGVMTMCVGHYYARLVGLSGTYNTLLSLVGLFGGYLLSMVAMSTISSAVATVYVCFADNPDALKECHPEEYYVLSNIWAKVFVSPSTITQPTNRRIVIKTMEEDKTVTSSSNNNSSDDLTDSLTPESSSKGSRTVRGTYRPPLPSDSSNQPQSNKKPFGFHIFSKKKNETSTVAGMSSEDSMSTIQLSNFVNDHAGYGGRASNLQQQQQHQQVYGTSSNSSSSSGGMHNNGTGSGVGIELTDSQKEALKVPLDLYHAATNLFGSTFSSNNNYSSSNNRDNQGMYASVSSVGDGEFTSNHNDVEETLNL